MVVSVWEGEGEGLEGKERSTSPLGVVGSAVGLTVCVHMMCTCACKHVCCICCLFFACMCHYHTNVNMRHTNCLCFFCNVFFSKYLHHLQVSLF